MKNLLIKLFKLEEKVKRDIAFDLVGKAGLNNISLRSEKNNFTGTYWISANGLFHVLTGEHLNSARERGAVVNEFFDELDK